jgi:hypothetical protein
VQFNISDVIGYIDTESTRSPIMSKSKIPEPLFSDDLVVASFTSYELRNKI